MAASSSPSTVAAFLAGALLLCALCIHGAAAQLCEDYYDDTCPDAYDVTKQVLIDAHDSDTRIFASLIRLHFHDCFVQGCDGSLLLDSVPGMPSEKFSVPNNNSARGYEVVDAVKEALEDACPGVVSCADILALAAEISVELSGGPSWGVLLGRLDGMTSDFNGSFNLPGPADNLTVLRGKFDALKLNDVDLVALSGGHTFGRVQCQLICHGQALQLQRHEHARPDPGPGLPGVPVAEVPEERRPEVPEQPRPDDAGHLRQELLHEPGVEAGVPRLRPGAQVSAGSAGHHGPDRGPVRPKPGRLLPKLRAVHDQHGEPDSGDRPVARRSPD